MSTITMEADIDAIKRRCLRRPFLNPYCDLSDHALSDEEVEILLRLANGDELIQERYYIAEHDTYAVGWYWDICMTFPRQWDGPVVSLISRGAIRPVRCAGGRTWMYLTDNAKKALGLEGKRDG